jgi:hypothetical protein
MRGCKWDGFTYKTLDRLLRVALLVVLKIQKSYVSQLLLGYVILRLKEEIVMEENQP